LLGISELFLKREASFTVPNFAALRSLSEHQAREAMAVTDMPTVHSTLSRPIYDRTYQPLKRFSWPWRLLATYASFMTW
jgi:hypothetical protein